jgi:ABC-type nitrate/sulfonate/bicarbonate transport system substrate-binding protein
MEKGIFLKHSVDVKLKVRVTKIEDLVGRKLGTPAGGTADEYLGVVLKKAGVPREKIQVLNVLYSRPAW